MKRDTSLSIFGTLFNAVFENTVNLVRKRLFPHGPSGPDRRVRIMKTLDTGRAESQGSENAEPWTQDYLETVSKDAKMMLDLTPGKTELQIPFNKLKTTLQCAIEQAAGGRIDNRQRNECGGAISSFRIWIVEPVWDFARRVEALDDNLAPSTRTEIENALESLKTYLRSFNPDASRTADWGMRFQQSKQNEADACRILMRRFEESLPNVTQALEVHLANQEKLNQAKEEITRAFASGELSSILRPSDQNSQSSASRG